VSQSKDDSPSDKSPLHGPYDDTAQTGPTISVKLCSREGSSRGLPELTAIAEMVSSLWHSRKPCPRHVVLSYGDGYDTFQITVTEPPITQPWRPDLTGHRA